MSPRHRGPGYHAQGLFYFTYLLMLEIFRTICNNDFMETEQKIVVIPNLAANIVDQVNNSDKPKDIKCLNKSKTDHLWKKGHCPNPNGRPKGNDYVSQLKKALKSAERAKGISFINHFVNTAYDNHRVMVALAKKILPDLTEGQLKDMGIQILINRPEAINIKKDEPECSSGQ
jgi:hypothetical protein